MEIVPLPYIKVYTPDYLTMDKKMFSIRVHIFKRISI